MRASNERLREVGSAPNPRPNIAMPPSRGSIIKVTNSMDCTVSARNAAQLLAKATHRKGNLPTLLGYNPPLQFQQFNNSNTTTLKKIVEVENKFKIKARNSKRTGCIAEKTHIDKDTINL